MYVHSNIHDLPGINELRKEIEIEVLYKWVLQNHAVDPSSIASFIYKCTSRAAVVRVLHELRLEIVAPGDIILVQDTFNRPEDGMYARTLTHEL